MPCIGFLDGVGQQRKQAGTFGRYRVLMQSESRCVSAA
jgi:hypothetical protein